MLSSVIQHIWWEDREFGKSTVAWMYFLMGGGKGSVISKFNFIVMLIAGPEA